MEALVQPPENKLADATSGPDIAAPILGEPGVNGGVRTPLEAARRGFAVGIPTLGTVSIEFAMSLNHQAMPINFGQMMLSPSDVKWDWEKNEVIQAPGHKGLPVADARNVIAATALKLGCEWLWFRDDDVVAPPMAINALFTKARDMLDRGVPLCCIGGNYPSKQEPPHSLILVEGRVGGWEHFKFGELVGGTNVMIGMGCTLIPVKNFEKIEPPWFKTVHAIEPDAKHYDRMADGIVHVGNDIQDMAPGCTHMTEDVYHIRKARRYGFTHTYCDTSVNCEHYDIKTGRKFFYNPQLARNVVAKGVQMSWHWRPGETLSTIKEDMGEKPFVKPEVVRFDLGQPGKREGWITVDLFEQSADEQVDITHLWHLTDKYGQADEIRASHILEHFPFRDTVQILSEWIRCLKPGGKIFIEVPDAEWGCENVLKNKDATPTEYLNELYKLIGYQSNPGDFHKCLFTKSYLEQILRDANMPLEDIQVEYHSYPDARVQRAIRAVAKRRVEHEPVPEGGDARFVELVHDHNAKPPGGQEATGSPEGVKEQAQGAGASPGQGKAVADPAAPQGDAGIPDVAGVRHPGHEARQAPGRDDGGGGRVGLADPTEGTRPRIGPEQEPPAGAGLRGVLSPDESEAAGGVGADGGGAAGVKEPSRIF